MTQHISDDLPLLLTGEATREETLAAAAHLRHCPDCQQELVSAVVAHASLASARRFARDLVSTSPTELPDIEAVLATARNDAAPPAKQPRRTHRRLLSVAAAAVVLAGAGVTIGETVGSGGGGPAGRTVVLDAFGVGTHTAKATITGGGTMRVDATSLPKLDNTHFYEVWLTNPARTRLQAVGSIGAGNRAQLTIAPQVMAQYSAIEVSVQGLRQTAYSGTSVLRGAYG